MQYGDPFDVSVDLAPVPTTPTFGELAMPPVLVKALARGRIATPTAVQSAVIPDALAGRDVLGRAATGSGKTLAFGLPILVRLASGRSKPKSPRALIIVPTRELAGQVRSSLEPLADAVGMKVATVYGGTPYDRQIKRLRAGVDVVVATPGRLEDLIRRGACRLDRVETTVLDEADHLCDLGFFPAVSALVAMTPAGSQRMLLSATLDGDVDRLVRDHLTNPVTHDCEPESEKPDLQHHILVSGQLEKLQSLAALLRANPRSIVFTRTRLGATKLATDLASLGVTTVDLHGNLGQGARERNLRKFRTGQADVVVATDVAARGIHIDGVNLVVHYDAPTERKSYLHRSGRTARAGNSGTVVTLTTPRQVGSVVRVQKAAGVTALHHDARTAPQPMTREALAASGTAPREAGAQSARSSRLARAASDPRPSSRSETRRRPSRRTASAPRGSGGRPPYKRSHDSRPRDAASPAVGSQDTRRTATSPRPAGVKAGRKPGSATRSPRKKARWTAAERRAGAKR